MLLNFLIEEGGLYMIESALMGLLSLYIFARVFTYNINKRMPQFLLLSTTTSTCLGHLCMYNNIGFVEYNNHIVNIPRYMEWLISTVIHIFLLGKIGRLTDDNLFGVCMLAFYMIISGLLSDMSSTVVMQWIFFALGCLFYIPIWIFSFEDFDYDLIRQYSGVYAADHYFFMIQYILITWFGYGVISLLQLSIAMDKMIPIFSYFVLDLFSKFGLTILIFRCMDDHQRIEKSLEDDQT